MTEQPLGSFASLSKRELEVLRLLASGHTVKTIAVQLGSSETAINERLRDARRKTGAASSRELARLVDAQKSGTRISIFRPRATRSRTWLSPHMRG